MIDDSKWYTYQDLHDHFFLLYGEEGCLAGELEDTGAQRTLASWRTLAGEQKVQNKDDEDAGARVNWSSGLITTEHGEQVGQKRQRSSEGAQVGQTRQWSPGGAMPEPIDIDPDTDANGATDRREQGSKRARDSAKRAACKARSSEYRRDHERARTAQQERGQRGDERGD